MIFIKQFFTLLLVLIMAISPVQVTMASDIDQNSQGINCQMSLMQMSDTLLNDNCPMQHDEECQQHPGCVAQFTVGALPQLNTLHSVLRDIAQIKLIPEIDIFVSQYPSLLKRPPKS